MPTVNLTMIALLAFMFSISVSAILISMNAIRIAVLSKHGNMLTYLLFIVLTMLGSAGEFFACDAIMDMKVNPAVLVHGFLLALLISYIFISNADRIHKHVKNK